MRIDKSGNVGIGTATPNGWSEVSGLTGINQQIYSASYARMVINAAASNPEIHLVKGDNTAQDRNYRFSVNSSDAA